LKFKDIISKAELYPKKLFLIDGFGAILSAFLLGVVLVTFEEIFGIPPSVLSYLAIIPIFFLVYDVYCYRSEHLKTGLFLKGIAILNLIYCCFSIGLVSYHFNTITYFGWAYVVLEIIIVIFLAKVEFSVGSKIIKART